MIATFFSRYRITLAAIVGVLVLLSMAALYAKGRADGRALSEADTKTDVIRQLKERNLTDEDVSRLSAADLCRELDGVFRDGRCE